jgi:hypothetical protein
MAAAHRTPAFRRTSACSLPPDLDFVAQGGVSHGEMCDWCGEDVASQSALIEIVWIRAGPKLATAFLHPECFDVWNSTLLPQASITGNFELIAPK